jgi:hypothetical protein
LDHTTFFNEFRVDELAHHSIPRDVRGIVLEYMQGPTIPMTRRARMLICKKRKRALRMQLDYCDQTDDRNSRAFRRTLRKHRDV